jgi:ribosomal protein S18 acetylase RimI-like enzyme
MTVTLRPGTPDDLVPCAAILYEAFRTISAKHSFPPDFPSREPAEQLMSFLLSSPDVYSVVAQSNGRAIGSNFLWETGPIVGVGPITVDPGAQDRSTGRRLMEKVLARAKERGFAGVRLVQAGYHTRSLSLYAKLGFDVREHLATLQGQPLGVSIPGLKVRPAMPADIASCNRLHGQIHGFDRGRDLQLAIDHGTAQVVERNGRIAGYTTGIGFFGHAIGEGNEELKALIGAAREFPGPGFLLPTRNGELFRWCLERGLKVVQPMTLMSLGLYNEPKGAWLPSILF